MWGTILAVIGVWFIASVPASVALGKFVAYSNHTEPPP